jgi:hypothetical protein
MSSAFLSMVKIVILICSTLLVLVLVIKKEWVGEVHTYVFVSCHFFQMRSANAISIIVSIYFSLLRAKQLLQMFCLVRCCDKGISNDDDLFSVNWTHSSLFLFFSSDSIPYILSDILGCYQLIYEMRDEWRYCERGWYY